MVLCIFAQSLISELNQTKSNHDHLISFDLVQLGSGIKLDGSMAELHGTLSFD